MSAAARCVLSAFPLPHLRHSSRTMLASASATCCLANPRTDAFTLRHRLHLALDSPSSSTSSRTGLCNFLEFPLLPPAGDTDEDADEVWSTLRREASLDAGEEPVLAPFYDRSVLAYPSLECALASHLAAKLSTPLVPSAVLGLELASVLTLDPSIGPSVRADLRAARDRDPACLRMVHCFLHYKGFHALQTHRIAHRLWIDGRKPLALFLQSRSTEVFAVDIHPGARVGMGILLDHATGVVVGETAVIGDNVSILHGVTLGGTGKEGGDRHPKLGDGVLVGAGTQILGRVKVGEGAKVGAGSVVLKEVPPRTTAVGNPARLVGGKENPIKLERIPSFDMDHTSWSDYVI